MSAHYRLVDGKGPLKVDEDAISRRYRQFTAAWAEKASTKSRSSTWNPFSRFLESRSNPGATCIEATQPKDAVEYLCWLDSCGTRRRTVVHARHCSSVGTKDLTACSTKPGECNLRYAHDSLRSNHVSKLGMVFEKELGVVDSWSSTLRIGNPVRSDLVTQYMAFTTGEQKCYESLERVIGINHKYWNHGKIKGTKAPLPLSTSEMALSLPEGL